MWKLLLAVALFLSALPAQASPHKHKAPDDTTIVVTGRVSFLPMRIGGRVIKQGDGYAYQWPGIYFESAFQGPFVELWFDDSANNFNVIVDSKLLMVVRKPGARSIDIGGLSAGPHTIRLEKRSETQYATGRFLGFSAYQRIPLPPIRARQIEFIGDSLTVGYGNTSAFTQCTPDEIFETTDSQEGFAALTGKHFDADYQINAFSGLGMVRNYDGKEHAKYHMPMLYPRAIFDDPTPAIEADWHPQVIVIGIGSNDFSTPLHAGEPWATPDALAADYQKTYGAFVQRIRAANPQARIIISWHTGDDDAYAANAQKLFESLKASGMTNIDSLVIPKLDYTGCNSHPNTRDDAKVAQLYIDYIDHHPEVWQGK